MRPPSGAARTVVVLVALACAGSVERPDVVGPELDAETEALRSEARETLHDVFARLVAVGHRLRRDGVALCAEDVAPLLGAAVARHADLLAAGGMAGRLSNRGREIEAATGAVDEVRVFAVVEGSPAARAGLAVGDLVLAVDGDATGKASDVLGSLRDSDRDAPVLHVRRGEAGRDLVLPRVEGCGPGILVHVGSTADTLPHRNRRDVSIPTGLVYFARDDDELAIATAHQMAHSLLGTSWSGSGEHEPPADRLGLRIAARAGFDVSKAPAFWDRLAAEEPWKIHPDPSRGSWRGYRIWHGAMALRAPVIRRTAAEIRATAR